MSLSFPLRVSRGGEKKKTNSFLIPPPPPPPALRIRRTTESRITAAIVRPLPTPAPSPQKNPSLGPRPSALRAGVVAAAAGRNLECEEQACRAASSWSCERRPVSAARPRVS